jgi:hypothetical protein
MIDIVAGYLGGVYHRQGVACNTLGIVVAFDTVLAVETTSTDLGGEKHHIPCPVRRFESQPMSTDGSCV